MKKRGATNVGDIDCEQALRDLAVYLDGELAGPRAAEMAQHLERCRSCYSRAEFEKGLKAQLAALRHEPPGEALEARIRELIARFPDAGTT
ncbi:MAG: anti-sigma factor family protein [Longimicrobiales bacterium]